MLFKGQIAQSIILGSLLGVSTFYGKFKPSIYLIDECWKNKRSVILGIQKETVKQLLTLPSTHRRGSRPLSPVKNSQDVRP